MSRSAFARDRWQDDQAGMKIDGAGELPEIIGVLRHDNPIFVDGASEDDVIGIAQPTAIPRVDHVVQALLVKMLAQRGRNALVDEKSHAADPRRRSTGRPTCGWVCA
ncbi:hypothetical protein [Methylovirgula sp. 4M-Z18]|uniref:hypothetical protein n=1 Tax=Methylovirgula sp. 4M-Z18 TaxID=2293567 RepID=UPI0011C05E47|nr:hypothetical protein [Methylovirgula sp. 4M-Z18]